MMANDRNVIPPADPTEVFFETSLVDVSEAGPFRDGQPKGSRITFGRPVVYDLVTLLTDKGIEPDYEIRSQLDRYEFRLVRLAATLHVEKRSAVSWFEVRVVLTPRSSIPGFSSVEPPVAYDLYPSQIMDEVQVEHATKISPTFKFEEIGEVSLGENALTTRYKRLEPKITAYGKREAEAYWRYMPGTDSEVAGGVREMDLIVRRARGLLARATILAKGSGRQWGFFPDPIAVEQQQFEI